MNPLSRHERRVPQRYRTPRLHVITGRHTALIIIIIRHEHRCGTRALRLSTTDIAVPNEATSPASNEATKANLSFVSVSDYLLVATVYR